jgi:dienelactone hydrolase
LRARDPAGGKVEDYDARGPDRELTMRIPLIVFAFVALFATPSHAAMVATPINYTVGGKKMQSMLVYDAALKTPRPGLVMAPDWMGMNDNQIALAKQIAGRDYVILVADVYGVDVRPKTPDEAGAASSAMYKHRGDLRARINGALDQLKAQVGKAPLDGRHWGAIGFCFGGATALDLARSGAAIGGVATFHANLVDDPTFADHIKARVLVMHGADDTFESPQQIAGFQNEMRDAKADWQFIIYGGAVHCFAIPSADGSIPGCKYDPPVAKRAFAQMHLFFHEVFAAR